ncbi:DUF5107 domain-containing protein [Leifsonia sp. NPDC058230]|uniref:DUF5107 domain-containing protein n=1 Tax=Leifsonia sp. NPDC058230 TaxID=3346391 RepID=UPI0036D94BFF
MLSDDLCPDAPEDLRSRLAEGGSIAWSAPVVIDTYEPAEPDEFPMFLDRRVYQGSSGRVYPIPFIDRVASEAHPRQWQAIHLENRWLRLVILPELGGRIHIGYDKTAGYDFFYRNDVIKPALVGLAGPWISGGVEFNWPQHHRPATFLPVDVTIEQHEDGAVTVWCSDHDPFTRMKGMHGIRLHPDKAVVELVARLHNRTSEVQTFLWWANVAARVHDDYQSFFPTDVHYVADHARRAITAFPAADRPYYGIDYPARAATGGDRIDFYRNIPVPTSYMVTDTEDDFFGGYDHKAGAGFVHVADRHIAPGKKQWTWGNAEFGQAWDRLLTDENGPYVELMAGVYTDNQPDFAWLEPGETKDFTQLWYPIHRIGPAHQATADAAVRMDIDGGVLTAGVAVTGEHVADIRLVTGSSVLYENSVRIAPGAPFAFDVEVPTSYGPDYELIVSSAGQELIRWRPRPDSVGEEPWTATEPPAPQQIDSADELYYTGIHLAQNRHPTRSPLPYWMEALARDPLDSRCNTAVADHFYRRGQYGVAEIHIRRALERQTRRNGNPRDGEARYLLGLILARTGREREAIDAFAKAAWDARWEAPAQFEIAQLLARGGRSDAALVAVERSLAKNPEDSRANALRAVLLRRVGRADDAELQLQRRLAIDPLDQVSLVLAGRPASADPRTMMDVALELAAYGETDHGIRMLQKAADAPSTTAGNVVPLAYLHQSLILENSGRHRDSLDALRRAHRSDTTRCFPSGLADHDLLQSIVARDAEDGLAASLLGMLLYDAGRESEALNLWERVIGNGDADPVTLRNAAIASVNLTGETDDAVRWYEAAIGVKASARLLYEYDQLLERTGADVSRRISSLERHPDAVFERDDLTIAYCGLLTAAGRSERALAILSTREFAPWEGGEGLALAAWEQVHLALSSDAEAAGDIEAALAVASAALTPPQTLGEARHPLANTREIHLRIAELATMVGAETTAREAREIADRQDPVTPDRSPAPDYFATSLPELLLFRSAPKLSANRPADEAEAAFS